MARLGILLGSRVGDRLAVIMSGMVRRRLATADRVFRRRHLLRWRLIRLVVGDGILLLVGALRTRVKDPAVLRAGCTGRRISLLVESWHRRRGIRSARRHVRLSGRLAGGWRLIRRSISLAGRRRPGMLVALMCLTETKQRLRSCIRSQYVSTHTRTRTPI